MLYLQLELAFLISEAKMRRYDNIRSISRHFLFYSFFAQPDNSRFLVSTILLHQGQFQSLRPHRERKFHLRTKRRIRPCHGDQCGICERSSLIPPSSKGWTKKTTASAAAPSDLSKMRKILINLYHSAFQFSSFFLTKYVNSHITKLSIK